MNIFTQNVLLFDFDGTLFNTLISHERAFQLTFEELKISVEFNYSKYRGLSTKKIIDSLGLIDCESEILRLKSQFYLESVNYATPFVEMENITSLRSLGLKTVIVSSSRLANIESVLEYYGFSKLFDAIISFESTIIEKPNPDPYFKAMCLFPGSSFIAIEDSFTGITSARKAGLQTVGVHNSELNSICDFYYDDINKFLVDFHENYFNYSSR